MNKDRFTKAFQEITRSSDPLNALSVAVFDDTAIEIIDDDGNRWAIANNVADAMKAERRSFRKLVKKLRQGNEIVEGRHFKYLPLETAGGTQNTLILSHVGVIRVCMRSNAPRAIEFRDWAETVLFSVMTKGAYVQPGAEGLLAKRVMECVKSEMSALVSASISQAIVPFTSRVEQLEHHRTEVNKRFSKIYVPRDTGLWPTPTQLLRVISKEPLPKGFNSGADFDRFAAEEHKTEFGHYPEARCRRYMQKRHDWVLEPCPEINDFVRRAYKKYFHTRWAGRQGKLKLVFPSSKKPKQK